MKITLIIMSALSILGIILTLITGLWIYNHDCLLADLSNAFNFHRFQAIKTIIFTIITIMLAFVRNMIASDSEPHGKSKTQIISATGKNT